MKIAPLQRQDINNRLEEEEPIFSAVLWTTRIEAASARRSRGSVDDVVDDHQLDVRFHAQARLLKIARSYPRRRPCNTREGGNDSG